MLIELSDADAAFLLISFIGFRLRLRLFSADCFFDTAFRLLLIFFFFFFYVLSILPFSPDYLPPTFRFFFFHYC